MSLNSKIVSTYSKSIFQTIKASSSTTTDVFIIGEELSLLRSTLTTSKKLKVFFDNPTYAENQKLEVLSSIFPGLTVTMKSFLKVLKERNHLNLIPQISDSYTDLLLEFKNLRPGRSAYFFKKVKTKITVPSKIVFKNTKIIYFEHIRGVSLRLDRFAQ